MIRRKHTSKQKFDLYWRIMAITELSLAAKAVATALLLKFHNEKTGRCDPGAGGIAKTVGLSRRAVFNAITELKTPVGSPSKARTEEAQTALIVTVSTSNA